MNPSPKEEPMPDTSINPNQIDEIVEHRDRHRHGVAIAALLAIAGLGAILLANPVGSKDQTFETVLVERRDLVATVSATGHLEPTDQVDVGSEISGIVSEVLADTNDAVVTGQVLARIDTTTLEQQAARSRAGLLSAEAGLRQALATQAEVDADLARFEEVHRTSGGRVPSQSELDGIRAAKLRADAAVKVAEADIAESRAALLATEIDLEKSVIRSPIDGIVLDRRVEPGQTVAASFQAPILFTIGQDLRRMNLTVYVSEADVGRVETGQIAAFTVDAWPEAEFGAIVRKVSFGSKTIENVVSYEAELEVANDDGRLRPGMTATAFIRVEERQDALVVTNAALRFRPPTPVKAATELSLLPIPQGLGVSQGRTTGDTVHVIRGGDLAEITVDTGPSDGQWTEIVTPHLGEGDEVVVDVRERTT
jgi:HlyD family secretion protein